MAVATPHHQGVKVLVVDASAEVRSRLVAQLIDEGFLVIGESDGVVLAVSLIATHAPDAIVADILLIDLRGLAVVERLRAAAPAACIVVMSNAVGYRRHCLAGGADAFLDKSSEFDALPATLRAFPRS